ncbi:NAD(P)/FAD-dependent oxidoreductase [Phocea massiliensis]|uniref:NAD(P)/FAD-dependent oxidoreductase n=1 Tax=Merdimmobilis hominis TaxID=2897707 RepID=A0A939BFP6_9FIRM|nr:NAD(P)/FAD-dependent oxidoreductase [Merdimmobilis hominis]MBM6921853.1 NAD(P)/FAD-dependent oxidoreductase [Merdimmobilis hominis]
MRAIIVGSGPAGVSAALYLARAGVSVTILSKDGGALLKADKIENYYGFAEPISGKELYEQGLANAKRLGCTVKEEEVIGVSFLNTLAVQTTEATYEAEAVILATGASRTAPKIDGLARLEGHGVSYCAICDAFFYRGKNVAVIGSGEYALHEAQTLLPVAGSVTMLTNGAPLTVEVPESIAVDTRKIVSIDGEDAVSGVTFADGKTIAVDGVFVAVGVASSADLARKLGALTEGNRIVTNENGETNLPGLYAAGDCTGGLLQIAEAVAKGAKAGLAAVRFLREQSENEVK